RARALSRVLAPGATGVLRAPADAELSGDPPVPPLGAEKGSGARRPGLRSDRRSTRVQPYVPDRRCVAEDGARIDRARDEEGVEFQALGHEHERPLARAREPLAIGEAELEPVDHFLDDRSERERQ